MTPDFTQLEVYGPYDIPHDRARRGTSKRINRSHADEFWASVEVSSVKGKQGCYVFALAVSRGFTPWYVGKTARSLGVEALTDSKLVRYNEVIHIPSQPGAIANQGRQDDGRHHANQFQMHSLPNPFQATTLLSFDLEEAAVTTVRVFDLRGRMVRTLLDQSIPEGRHDVVWDGRNTGGSQVSAGVYFYTVQSGSGAEQKKVVKID